MQKIFGYTLAFVGLSLATVPIILGTSLDKVTFDASMYTGSPQSLAENIEPDTERPGFNDVLSSSIDRFVSWAQLQSAKPLDPDFDLTYDRLMNELNTRGLSNIPKEWKLETARARNEDHLEDILLHLGDRWQHEKLVQSIGLNKTEQIWLFSTSGMFFSIGMAVLLFPGAMSRRYRIIRHRFLETLLSSYARRALVMGSAFWLLVCLAFVVLFEPYGSYISDDETWHLIKLIVFPPATVIAGYFLYTTFVKPERRN